MRREIRNCLAEEMAEVIWRDSSARFLYDGCDLRPAWHAASLPRLGLTPHRTRRLSDKLELTLVTVEHANRVSTLPVDPSASPSAHLSTPARRDSSASSSNLARREATFEFRWDPALGTARLDECAWR